MNDDQSALLQTIAETALPLLQAMDALSWGRQRVDPYAVEALHDAIKDFVEPLKSALPNFRTATFPENLADFRQRLDAAAGATLAAYEGLAPAAEADGFDALRLARRAFRQHLEAERALYPLAAMSPPISQYYLPADAREDQALLAKLDTAADQAAGRGGVAERPGPDGADKGGYALYTPEYLDPMTPAPVVLALHGGRGDGKDYLWSWLAAARAKGCVLIAPTALGDTWALMGEDVDSPNLAHILDEVDDRQALDRSRVLMTGMSDGGTFSYVAGLLDGAAATHLAPFAASFHPMLLEFVSDERLAELPIRLCHGARDWMFPVGVAQKAAEAFEARGARIEYRELPDRAHVFPQDEAAPTLDWFLGTAGAQKS